MKKALIGVALAGLGIGCGSTVESAPAAGEEGNIGTAQQALLSCNGAFVSSTLGDASDGPESVTSGWQSGCVTHHVHMLRGEHHHPDADEPPAYWYGYADFPQYEGTYNSSKAQGCTNSSLRIEQQQYAYPDYNGPTQYYQVMAELKTGTVNGVYTITSCRATIARGRPVVPPPGQVGAVGCTWFPDYDQNRFILVAAPNGNINSPGASRVMQRTGVSNSCSRYEVFPTN